VRLKGPAVVVNDLGVNPEGGATQEDPASSVVAEIRSAGGRAVANKRSIANALAADRIDTKIVGNPLQN
jgi:hypothetical protein